MSNDTVTPGTALPAESSAWITNGTLNCVFAVFSLITLPVPNERNTV